MLLLAEARLYVVETRQWPRLTTLLAEGGRAAEQPPAHDPAARTLPPRYGRLRDDGRLQLTLVGFDELLTADDVSRIYLGVLRHAAAGNARVLSCWGVRKAFGLRWRRAALMWRLMDLDPEVFRRTRVPGCVRLGPDVSRYATVRTVAQYEQVREALDLEREPAGAVETTQPRIASGSGRKQVAIGVAIGVLTALGTTGVHALTGGDSDDKAKPKTVTVAPATTVAPTPGKP
jgi:hypothetical protein